MSELGGDLPRREIQGAWDGVCLLGKAERTNLFAALTSSSTYLNVYRGKAQETGQLRTWRMTPKEILSRNLRRAVSKDVGLAGILLYIPAEICVVPNRVAWTDGQKTYFAEEYFKYEPEEQVAIAIHEGLHVALRHVQRGKALAVLEGPRLRSADLEHCL